MIPRERNIKERDIDIKDDNIENISDEEDVESTTFDELEKIDDDEIDVEPERDEIVSTIDDHTHTVDVDGNKVPSYCFVHDITDIFGLSNDEAVDVAKENGYVVYKVIPNDADIEDGLVIADKECSKDLIVKDYQKFFGVEIDIEDIVKEDEEPIEKDVEVNVEETPEEDEVEVEKEVEVKEEPVEEDLDNTYGCDKCGKRVNDNDVHWFEECQVGLCDDCYDKLSSEEKEKLYAGDVSVIEKPVEESIKEDDDCILNEVGLSRMLKHTQDKDTFAIIGSQDKDTKEDRFFELISEVRKLKANKSKDKKESNEQEDENKEKKIGFNRLEGTYTYDSGEVGTEDSLIIYNISKEDAINLGKKLNQECIIWKDGDFFGFVYMDGRDDENMFKGGLSFDKEAVKSYGSKLKGKHNNAQPFVFESVLVETTNRGSNFSRQGKSKIEKNQLFKVRVNNNVSEEKSLEESLANFYDPYTGTFTFNRKDFLKHRKDIYKYADDNEYYGVVSEPAINYPGNEDYLGTNDNARVYFLTSVWDGGYEDDDSQHIIKMPKKKYDESMDESASLYIGVPTTMETRKIKKFNSERGMERDKDKQGFRYSYFMVDKNDFKNAKKSTKDDRKAFKTLQSSGKAVEEDVEGKKDRPSKEDVLYLYKWFDVTKKPYMKHFDMEGRNAWYVFDVLYHDVTPENFCTEEDTIGKWLVDRGFNVKVTQGDFTYKTVGTFNGRTMRWDNKGYDRTLRNRIRMDITWDEPSEE